MGNNEKRVDVAIIGGGHAGCEAALACARLGFSAVMFAISPVAMMPCNPNIGGSSKGHLVREIDALGGEMGRNIDKTFIQSRMLNRGKGPAVYSLRAQADKRRYAAEMRRVLESADNLRICENEIVDILTDGGAVAGVVTETGAVYNCRAAIVCAGTYLNARCLCGDTVTETGPDGQRGSLKLSGILRGLGLPLMRFKTGTPARISRLGMDFSKMVEQPGDGDIVPFSFDNQPEDLTREQISCWLTYTTAETHEIISRNIHRSPMYSGLIEGAPTRYCPSIEDKIVRFADKDRHQVFIEPEGEDTDEMYIAGMSTSLPEDAQEAMYRSVPGLEDARIIRHGYAIEYDCLDATCLNLSLECKTVPGLFFAGQINGSSGYEEAAAQGLIAGINAALKLQGREPLIIDRSEGYIGVLIDDLVTKGTKEPYRMMTSRAEYRLLLRQDNADLRLRGKGYAAGLIDEKRYARLIEKQEQTEREIKRAEKTVIAPSEIAASVLTERGSSDITTGATLAELIRRPELDYAALAGLDPARPDLSADVAEQVNIQIKYAGYIKRQISQVEQFRRMEGKLLPEDIDYSSVPGLRIEGRQKLTEIRPRSIGHASRITGVSPADVAMVAAYYERRK
ncbi:MAG: tRNA uridine-5-carboxymethylaminomethyl(34) synthesis enzyme MnmG [Defluviitaleaceae bacterium]|nr:tRNA uridine-5-carboxymethylaminomethyl(34) synthesis enzyme MnmG [Defluviitaleaceae bacterium]